MNETSDASPQPPPAPSPPPPPPGGPPWSVPATLVRPRDGRVFRGVCAAMGRYTGTDPVLWRVVVAVLAVFGGTGIVLYLAGWLLIPDEGSAHSEAERLVDSRSLNPVVVVLLGGLLLLALLMTLDGDGGGLVPLAVLGLVGYLVMRNRQSSPATSSSSGWAAAPAWTDPERPLDAPPPWGPPPPGPAYGAPLSSQPPPPPRRRSILGWVTLSAAVLVVGALLLAAALGVDGVTVERVLATALLVVGAGLLVGAVAGRARWLVLFAVPLALALSAVSAVGDAFDTSTGSRTWVVSGSAEHALGAGEATLDLRPLAGNERRDLAVDGRVGVGQLVVLVPADQRVRLDASVGLGELRVTELDGRSETTEGSDVDDVIELGPPGARTVELDVRVGFGSLEVRRVAS